MSACDIDILLFCMVSCSLTTLFFSVLFSLIIVFKWLMSNKLIFIVIVIVIVIIDIQQPKIFSITETWCPIDLHDGCFSLPGYHPHIRKDRVRGREVLPMVHESIDVTV